MLVAFASVRPVIAADDHAHAQVDDHDHEVDPHAEEAHVDEVRLTEAAIREYRITIEEAGLHVLSPMLVAPGRVSFNTDAMAHVGSIVKGRVVELRKRVGDVVKKDEELVIVESSELGQAQTEYLQRKSAIAIAQSAVEPTKNAYERAKSLFEGSQGIALGEVQKREADYLAAQGALQTAKAAASAAENTLRLYGMSDQARAALDQSGTINAILSIRAPISGTVIEREVTLGESINPDKEALMILADTSRYWVLADVPGASLAEITIGAAATIEMPGVTGTKFAGKVAMIDPSVDPDTRSGRVRVEVDGHASIRPGMFARVSIATGSEKNSETMLAIPEQAVQTVEGGPAVFVPVEGEPNTFAKRSVQIGRPIGGRVPVLSGLTAGEKFVVGGSFILKADLGKSGAAHEH